MFFPPDNTTATRPDEPENPIVATAPLEEEITDGWDNDEYDDLDLVNAVVVAPPASLDPTGEDPPTDVASEPIMDNIPVVSPYKPQFDDSQMAIIGWSEDENNLTLDDDAMVPEAPPQPSSGRVTPPPASGNSMLSAEMGSFEGVSQTPTTAVEKSVEELGIDLITRSPLGRLKKSPVECLPVLPVDAANDDSPEEALPTPSMTDVEQGSMEDDAWDDDDNLDIDDADLDISDDHKGLEETPMSSTKDDIECPIPPPEIKDETPLTATFKQVEEIITYDQIKPPSSSLRDISTSELGGRPKPGMLSHQDSGNDAVIGNDENLSHLDELGLGDAIVDEQGRKLVFDMNLDLTTVPMATTGGVIKSEIDAVVIGWDTKISTKAPPLTHRDSSMAVVGWNENESDLDAAGLGDDEDPIDEPTKKEPYQLQHADSSLAVIGWNENETDLDAAGLGDDESDVIASVEEGLPTFNLKIIDEVPSFEETDACPKLETTCDSSLRIPQGDDEDDGLMERSEEGWNDDGLDDITDDAALEPNQSTIDYDLERVTTDRYSQTAVSGEQTEEGWNDDDLNLESPRDPLDDDIDLPRPAPPTIETTLSAVIPPVSGEETTEQHPPPPDAYPQDGWDDDDAILDLDIPDEERPSDDHVDRLSVPSDVIASDRLLVPSGTGEETEEGWPGDSGDNLNLGESDVVVPTTPDDDDGEITMPNQELTIPTGASVTPTAARNQDGSFDFSHCDVIEEGRTHSETLVVPTGDEEESVDAMEGAGRVSCDTEEGDGADGTLDSTPVASHYDLTSLLEHQSDIIEKLESCKSRLSDGDLVVKINSIISELIFYYEQYNNAAQDHVEKSLYQQQENLVNELQSQLDSRDAIGNELRHDLDKLKKQSHEWAATESSLNSQIDALNETITTMTASHAKELSSVTERLDSQIEVSRQSLIHSQTLQKTIDQIENEVKDAAMKERELGELKIQFIVLQEKFDKQTETMAEIGKSRQEERLQYEEQLTQSQIVHGELAESREQLEMALKGQEELSAKIQQNETTISSMKKQLATMKVQKDELKWQYDDSIARCNKQKSKIDSLLKENKKNEELAAKNHESYRALCQETSQLKKDMQAKFHRVVKTRDESETKLKDQLSQKDASIKQYQKKLRAVTKEKKRIHADNEELYVQLGYLRQQHEMETERHDVEMQNLERIAEEKNALLEEIERLQSCVCNVDSSMGIDREVHDRALEENERLREELTEMKEVLSQMETQQSDTERTLEDNKQLRDELTSMKETLSQMETQQSDTERTLEDNEHLREELTLMKEALSQMETQQSDSERQLLFKDEQIDNLSRENQTLVQQVANITSNLSEADGIIRTKDCYEERLQSMNDQYAALQVELKNLALEMKNTKDAISTIAPSNQSEEATSFGFLQRIQTLNRQIERLNQAFDRQMQEIDRNSELILTLQNEKLNSESFVLDRKEQEIELYKQQIRKIGADLETSKTEATEYMKLSVSLKQNVEEANLQLSEKADRIQRLENELLLCEGDGNEVRSNDDAIIMQQKREIMELKQLIENKDAQLDGLVSDKQVIEEKLKHTQKELESSQANAEALTRENSSIEAMKKQVMAAEDEVTKSNSRNDDLEGKLCERDARIEELEKQNEALKAALEDERSQSKVESSNAKLNMDKIRHDLAAKEQEMLQNHIQMEAYKGELKAFQLSLDAKEREISSLLGKLEEFKQEQQMEIDLTSHLLNGSTTTSDDDATVVETLRKQVIGLAKAVERAETQRAEALERVAKERKMNAESLRRIGDSVRKFYSSHSHSDKIQ